MKNLVPECQLYKGPKNLFLYTCCKDNGYRNKGGMRRGMVDLEMIAGLVTIQVTYLEWTRLNSRFHSSCQLSIFCLYTRYMGFLVLLQNIFCFCCSPCCVQAVASFCAVLQCWASLGELELVYFFLSNGGGIWVNIPLWWYRGNKSHFALQQFMPVHLRTASKGDRKLYGLILQKCHWNHLVEEGKCKVKLECSTALFHYHDKKKTRQLDEVNQWEHFLFRKCIFRTSVLEWLRCHVHYMEKEGNLVKIGIPWVLLFCIVH